MSLADVPDMNDKAPPADGLANSSFVCDEQLNSSFVCYEQRRTPPLGPPPILRLFWYPFVLFCGPLWPFRPPGPVVAVSCSRSELCKIVPRT